jgi:two-component system sensor histidine kinase AlgZ
MANSGDWPAAGELFLPVQWIAVCSQTVLCVLRGPLRRVGNVWAAAVSWITVLAVSLLVSELAWRFFLPAIRVAAQERWRFQFGQQEPGVLEPVHALAESHGEFLLTSVCITGIVAAVVLRYFYVQFQWQARVESENRARIQALQSRIRPHFLFNSMNTIASLTRSDPALAEQVTEDLASLFRVTLSDARVSTTIGQEMELCRQYLRIEAVRLGERLRSAFDIDALPQDALLPALSLQPLLENAVYHGVEPSPEGGKISVSGGRDGKRLWIRIENTCPEDSPGSSRPGNRMALDNVRQRLAAFFGSDGELRAEHTRGDGEQGYCVELHFTARNGSMPG